MHRIIDKMTKFFEEELPIEVINDVTDAGKALEWDPVESLVELGTRLEMYVRQLEVGRGLIVSIISNINNTKFIVSRTLSNSLAKGLLVLFVLFYQV